VDVAHFDETDHTWVKGAFQTIDRPYGSLINLLHHGEATHARECLCALARSSFFVFVAVSLALFLSLSLSFPWTISMALLTPVSMYHPAS
jgi:hypothetical protein